ncbi:MAG: glycosyltransferase family 4 protein [Bryobacteraceae bacterium]
MAKPPCVLFLLDWKPAFWSTREEYFRRMSCALAAQGITPILTVSEEVEPRVRARLESAGTQLIACPYAGRYRRYLRHIGGIAARYSVELAQVRFFDYFSLVPWLCRSQGIRRIVFTESNGGEWQRGGMKAWLVRQRTVATCGPLTFAIGISRFIRDRLESIGIPSRKLRVVYNGIDTDAFLPDPAQRALLAEELGMPVETRFVVFASALLDSKRPEMAIDAISRLPQGSRPVQLLIAGEGPKRRELEELAAQRRAPVRFLGYYPAPQRLLQASDLFLHTTLGEAFGNVLAEAAACGVPVVGSLSGGAPEVVDDGRTGLLVKPGEGEAKRLAAAMARLLNDEPLRSEFGRAGIDRARRLFGIDRSVAETLEVYREATSGRIAPAGTSH